MPPGRRIAVAVILLAFATSLHAQQAINFASVSGRVVDTAGGVVPGAQVTRLEESTKSATTALTDNEGRFRLAYLRPGRHRLTIALPGFATFVRTLTLQVGAAIDLPVTLSVGTVTETVTVDGDGMRGLETARSQIAGTLSIGEVKALPLNGRNFLDLALLIPGVSPTNVGGGTQLFPETSAVPGVGISIGSQRNLSNNFMVDGLSANDDAAALSGISFGVDAIEQFQVVTSGGQAELGRALGGHINIATRSGTNFFARRRLRFLPRRSRSTRPNALSGTKLPMHQNQFGGSVGGPLARSRTFLFANIERRRSISPVWSTISDRGCGGDQRAAAPPSGMADRQCQTGVYRKSGRHDAPAGEGRSAPASHGKAVRAVQPVRRAQPTMRGRRRHGRAVGVCGNRQSRPDASGGRCPDVLSERTVLESRGQIAYSDLAAPPADLVGTGRQHLPESRSFGRLSVEPDRADEHDVSGRQQPAASARCARRFAQAPTFSTTI